jgi:gas vesicle protein
MSDRDNTDLWTAVAIGAVVGIGTALLVRARQDDDTQELLRRLRPVRRRAERAAKVVQKQMRRRTHQAGSAAGDLVSAGREVIEDLRKGAAEIVREARDELQKAARESVREARRASRSAARRVGR